MYKKYSTNYIRICGIKKINSANEAKQKEALILFVCQQQ